MPESLRSQRVVEKLGRSGFAMRCGSKLAAGTFVSVRIMHRRSVESGTVSCGSFTARRRRPLIAFSIVEGMIDVTVEAIGPVIPGPSPDENASGKPLGPVIAIRGAGIGRRFIVSVRTDGRSDRYACGNVRAACGQYRNRTTERQHAESFSCKFDHPLVR